MCYIAVGVQYLPTHVAEQLDTHEEEDEHGEGAGEGEAPDAGEEASGAGEEERASSAEGVGAPVAELAEDG